MLEEAPEPWELLRSSYDKEPLGIRYHHRVIERVVNRAL